MENKTKNIARSVGKIVGKGAAAVGILGASALGVKIANDIANSCYKDCKAIAIQESRKIKNELEQDQDEEIE